MILRYTVPIPERENSTCSYTLKMISSAKANTELSTTTMLHVRNEDERVAFIKNMALIKFAVLEKNGS
jgi:hypothetical protein